MNATSAHTVERSAEPRTAFPTVSIQGHPLTVLHMDASSLTASTTLRLLPGRRAAMHLDATTIAVMIETSNIVALGKDSVTYAVRLVSEVPFGCSAS